MNAMKERENETKQNDDQHECKEGNKERQRYNRYHQVIDNDNDNNNTIVDGTEGTNDCDKNDTRIMIDADKATMHKKEISNDTCYENDHNDSQCQ